MVKLDLNQVNLIHKPMDPDQQLKQLLGNLGSQEEPIAELLTLLPQLSGICDPELVQALVNDLSQNEPESLIKKLRQSARKLNQSPLVEVRQELVNYLNKLVEDEYLCKLIRIIVESKDGNQKQQEAMDRLLILIAELPGVYYARRQEGNHPWWKDLDDDAHNLALRAVSTYQGTTSGRYLCRFVNNPNVENAVNLENSSPEKIRKAFVNRFNRTKRNKLFDECRQHKKSIPEDSIDQPINDDESDSPSYGNRLSSEDNLWGNPEQSGMDSLIEKEEQKQKRLYFQRIFRYIKEDPDRALRDSYPRGYPQANMQELLLRRLDLREQFSVVNEHEPILFFQGDPNAPTQSWKKIAKELKIPYKTVTRTVSSHYSRQRKKFIAQFLADQ